MILEELINTYEELKKYVFIVNTKNNNFITIRFKDENFFHLIGLHKINLSMFIPNYIKSKDKIYKYIKKNVKKYNNVILNQVAEKSTLEYRMKTFHYILNLLKSDKTILFNLKPKIDGSLYDGDFGLFKVFEDINCLLGLKKDSEHDNVINCIPQSWMASNRINYLVEFRKAIYIENIYALPISMYNENMVIA